MRTAATSFVVLAAFAPSLAEAAPLQHRRPSGFVPRFAFRSEGPLAPAVTFSFRGALGREDALLGRPSLRLYRALPEVLFSLQPAPGLEIFVGGGAGPAYLMGGRGRRHRARTELTFSASLGVRFDIDGLPITATARAEAVVGQGAAVMLRLKIDLPGGR